jgi:uncharacterized membrane protein
VIGVLRFLHLLALGLWVGEIAFFSFVVAPVLFSVLPPEHAGEVVSGIFPRYYALGTAAAAVALVASLALARHAAPPGRWTGVAACVALGLVATLWAATVVAPRAQRLRVTLQAAGRPPAEDDAFRRAHRDAVVLNAAALLAGLAGLGLTASAIRQ